MATTALSTQRPQGPAARVVKQAAPAAMAVAPAATPEQAAAPRVLQAARPEQQGVRAAQRAAQQQARVAAPAAAHPTPVPTRTRLLRAKRGCADYGAVTRSMNPPPSVPLSSVALTPVPNADPAPNVAGPT